MMAGPAVRDAVAAVDWRQPWLAPYRSSGMAAAAALAAEHNGAARVAGALNRQRRPDDIRFIGADRMPAGEHYEPFIHATCSVPTHDNLHDLFNGLVWFAFPHAKRRLNTLQAGEIANAGVQATRGALRDAIAVFDENGALLQAPAELLQALARRDWQALFVAQRALWRDARLVLFGHALLEKLVRPRKAICAHVLPLAPDAREPAHDADALDAALAARLDRAVLIGKPFLPLPVLGVPGWWAPNDDPAFYDDAAVFRAAPGAA